MKYLYGIFLHNGHWAMETNRNRALKLAKDNNGVVTRMRNPEARYWDLPTFLLCSDIRANYTNLKGA